MAVFPLGDLMTRIGGAVRPKATRWRRLPDGSRALLLARDGNTKAPALLIAHRGRRYAYVEMQAVVEQRGRVRPLGRWDEPVGQVGFRSIFGMMAEGPHVIELPSFRVVSIPLTAEQARKQVTAAPPPETSVPLPSGEYAGLVSYSYEDDDDED